MNDPHVNALVKIIEREQAIVPEVEQTLVIAKKIEDLRINTYKNLYSDVGNANSLDELRTVNRKDRYVTTICRKHLEHSMASLQEANEKISGLPQEQFVEERKQMEQVARILAGWKLLLENRTRIIEFEERFAAKPTREEFDILAKMWEGENQDIQRILTQNDLQGLEKAIITVLRTRINNYRNDPVNTTFSAMVRGGAVGVYATSIPTISVMIGSLSRQDAINAGGLSFIVGAIVGSIFFALKKEIEIRTYTLRDLTAIGLQRERPQLERNPFI